MNATLLLVLLVVFSFAISRLLARFAAQAFVVSGVEYVLIGVALGPTIGPTVVSVENLAVFRPLVELLLGFVGFILGLRARDAFARADVATAGVTGALLVVAAVSAASLALLEPWGRASGGPSASDVVFVEIPWGADLLWIEASVPALAIALTLGCAAAVSSPVLLTQAALVHRARGPALELLRELAVHSQFVAVLGFGVVMAAERATEAASSLQITTGQWAVATGGAGVLCGVLFTVFLGRDRDATRISVATLGAVTFASGIGSVLGVSPLAVNAIAGIVVAMTSQAAPVIEGALAPVRHPILVLLRLFAGALWSPVVGWMWALPLVYVGVRVLVRRFTVAPLLRTTMREPPRLPRLGNALLGQGGLAVAIAVSWTLIHPEAGGVVLTTVVVGLIVSDLWSVRAIRRVLADAGEVDAITREEARRAGAALLGSRAAAPTAAPHSASEPSSAPATASEAHAP
jgi:hypothetical protein